MSVEVHGSGLGGAWGDLGDVGLEDVSASDIQMPRIQLLHDTGKFRDASTGVELDSLECVILGLVKQRIMWDTEVDEGDKPQCKSPNHTHGYPQMRTDIPARKQFPWSKSNFDPKDFPVTDGQIVLPCDSCVFANWGADKSKPPCSEQYTFALYYRDAEGEMRPGLLSLQRSGMKPAKVYTGTFAAAKQPMFTVWTRISLTLESRGKVTYSVPKFTKGELSDRHEWPGFAEQYRSVREFLHQAPRPATKEEDDKEAAARSGSSRPAPASAASATKLTDDDPWSTSTPAAAPAAASAPADDDLPF